MESSQREEERSMAFDLLGSGSDGEGGGFTKRLRRSYSSSQAQTGDTPPPMRQRLLRAIHQELSVLAAEADGVSEKVKVCLGGVYVFSSAVYLSKQQLRRSAWKRLRR